MYFKKSKGKWATYFNPTKQPKIKKKNPTNISDINNQNIYNQYCHAPPIKKPGLSVRLGPIKIFQY